MHSEVRSLKLGEKYTLAGFSLLGFPYHVNFTLKFKRCDSFEQYAETYVLAVMRKDIKKMSFIRLDEGKQFVIWPGYVTPDTRVDVSYSTKEVEGGGLCRIEYRWGLNDPRYLKRAIESIAGVEPIVAYMRPVKDKLQIFHVAE